MKEVFQLKKWFNENKRDFPWRREVTPYRVLVSEMMLQQTRASVVVAYFEKWMERFPSIQALASASIEEVIKLWEGLGYYSRARYLHAAAIQIMSEFGGEIPDSEEKLRRIRGLGPYTIGALLSFGFHKRSAAIDGNVMRVLSRYFLIEENIQKQRTKKRIETLADHLLDAKEPWITAEALIELGASLCGKKPLCNICPLAAGCGARISGKAEYLPIKSAAIPTTAIYRTVFLIEVQGKMLVRKGASGRIMADLYEFPYIDRDQAAIEQKAKELPMVKHSFTRYLAHLYPFHIAFSTKKEVSSFFSACGISASQYEWTPVDQLVKLPFSAGHRKILQNWMGL